jgi:hypothetical protein
MPDPLAHFRFDRTEAQYIGGSVRGEKAPRLSDGQYFEWLSKQRQDPFVEETVELPDLLAKTLLVRKPNEGIKSLIARCGISPQQIREWNPDRIQKFCDQQTLNRIDDDAVALAFAKE